MDGCTIDRFLYRNKADVDLGDSPPYWNLMHYQMEDMESGSRRGVVWKLKPNLSALLLKSGVYNSCTVARLYVAVLLRMCALLLRRWDLCEISRIPLR